VEVVTLAQYLGRVVAPAPLDDGGPR
jgi:hypothetical protein